MLESKMVPENWCGYEQRSPPCRTLSIYPQALSAHYVNHLALSAISLSHPQTFQPSSSPHPLVVFVLPNELEIEGLQVLSSG